MIMMTKKITKYVKVLFYIQILFSCTSNNIQNELDSWCKCEKEASENPSILDSCNQIMIDISIKYEFDPESVPLIRKKVKNCK